MGPNICIFSEDLSAFPNEGIRKFSFSIMEEMSKENRVLGIGNRENDSFDDFVKYIPTGRSLISFELKREIRKFAPDIIFYIPTASGSLPSFIKAHILKFYGLKAKTAMVLLQPRPYNLLFRIGALKLRPDVVFTQSPASAQELASLGITTKPVCSGVDLAKFCPVKRGIKMKLRKKYDLSFSDYIILHVGHINANRNVRIFKEFKDCKGTQVVLVTGASRFQDKDLIKELEQSGLRILSNYMESIEEVYQLADCYVFPVFSETASIEVPLSVLEAMACNLPIVSTRFRGLSILGDIDEKKGFFCVDTVEEVYSKTKAALQITMPQTRNMVQAFTWKSIARYLVQEVLEV